MKLKKEVVIGVVIVVVIVLVVLLLKGSKLIGRGNEELNEDLAKNILNTLGENGIAWYCGDVETITDNQGNVYGDAERQELIATLGNVGTICR